jgi:uncharacterized protein
MQLTNGHFVFSPSDVTSFLACQHLTALSLQVARGEIEKPHVEDEQAELVFRKGMEHEHAHLQRLKDAGKSVVEVSLKPDLDWQRAASETIVAMQAAADVIYQGVLLGDHWHGVADFLMRVETPSELGPWSYEAHDTKLARSSKPPYILQLCFYSERIAAIHGRQPDQIHVLLGNLEQESFQPSEFGAYYRRVCRRLEEFVADPPATEPYPCGGCDTCDFRPLCDERWDSVDHLCRVAGIRRTQIEKLAEAGITTLADLGRANADAGPTGISRETFEKLREQASLQLVARETGLDSYVILAPQPESGFSLLPDPSPGDLFFDFEGDPFWDNEGSLEYLWGILDTNDEFKPLFAEDHASERQAFERFVDLVHERLAQDTAMHVYHYAPYEITALRRLMGRNGTREEELDDLLRRNVFVDLFKVVRGGLRVSRPSYGLKEMEAFLDFEREAEIKEGGSSIVAFEEWMVTREKKILDRIFSYNREDCVATRLLRDWLLERRAEALDRFGPFPVPEPVESKPAPPQKQERAELREALLERGDETLTLAAQLLDYHNRERKPVWWAFFDRIEMTSEELIEDADSIGGLVPQGEPAPVARSFVYTLSFPPQEHRIATGEQPFDPATANSAGTVTGLDRDAGLLELKRGPSLRDVPLPEALVPGGPYATPSQESALERIGRSLLEGTRRYPAVESVLRREPFPHSIQTNDLDELEALLLSLDGRQLVIQGPPGSGKTWISGRLAARLIRAGKRVGVASTSHRAIHNLLEAVEEAAKDIGLDFRGLKKASGGNPESFYEGNFVQNVTSAGDCTNCELAAGTAWLFSHPDHDSTFDYLFIDEAGQVSLADALAMGTSARNLVLVGDPQQLDQVLQGSHPDGSDQSVLRYLIGEVETIPPERGIFLEHTYRLHPDVCNYISEEFYDSRLLSAPETATRTTPLGTGLRWLSVEHEGRRQSSAEEAEAVRAEVERLTEAGVEPREIKVVAPYNAQVNLLRSVLPAEIDVGTVDKFQGQEAKVVFYSMASSSADEIPHGLEFLFSRNRLNVAISRAQCLAYLVCSPRLLDVNCRTIDQMRLANALCRFVEVAAEQGRSSAGL